MIHFTESEWLELTRFAQSIASKLVREMGFRADREELHSEAMLALCDCRSRFDESLGVGFKTFSYLRIRGAVLDWIRRSYRYNSFVSIASTKQSTESFEPMPLEEYCSQDKGPLERCESRAVESIFETLLSGLSPNEQTVLRLLYYRDLDPSEASALLGGKSKSWISRHHRDALFSLQLGLKEYIRKERSLMDSAR